MLACCLLWRASRSRWVFPASGSRFRLKAPLKRLHQIDHRGFTWLLDNRDFLALLLFLDETLDVFPIGVVKLAEFKFCSEVLDETLGHLKFFGRKLRLWRFGLVPFMQLLLIVERVQNEAAVGGAD